MSITYPLSTPTSIGIAAITLRARNAVAISESPFSFNQQIVRHAGQRWEADVTIPPLRKDLMEPWVSFLVALQGSYGTFLLGDPNMTEPQGTATSLVASGARGESSLTVVSINGTLKAGDYLQFGPNGANAYLYKVLFDYSVADASGGVPLEIWPSLRAGTSGGGDSVGLTNATGVFRLSTPMTEWSINNNNAYGISFSAVEVL